MSDESQELLDKIQSLMEQNQKIKAIKYYREQTGCGLKEAKDAVEQIAKESGIEVKSGMGCFGMVLFALVMSHVVITCFSA